MTVKDLLSVAHPNTSFEIWTCDSCTPILGVAWDALDREISILNREVAEFKLCPISSDAANLVIYLMGEENE